MHIQIQEKLKEIERQENCRILAAFESGSRAWGFASPDSDYDVRFVYARSREAYLRLNPVRDVIEEPIDEMLDIAGWDVSKMLRLLHNANPTVFEWFSSPIVYRKTSFADQLKPIMQNYFSPQCALRHYLHMAEGNYREYLKSDMVRAKKYFYVLRPILACRWIQNTNSPPPMLFSELVESQLDDNLKETIGTLLDLKKRSPEIKLIPRIDALNTYIDRSFIGIRERIERLPHEPPRRWDELNALFLVVLQ